MPQSSWIVQALEWAVAKKLQGGMTPEEIFPPYEPDGSQAPVEFPRPTLSFVANAAAPSEPITDDLLRRLCESMQIPPAMLEESQSSWSSSADALRYLEARDEKRREALGLPAFRDSLDSIFF